jgi:hypothetical protein
METPVAGGELRAASSVTGCNDNMRRREAQTESAAAPVNKGVGQYAFPCQRMARMPIAVIYSPALNTNPENLP